MRSVTISLVALVLAACAQSPQASPAGRQPIPAPAPGTPAPATPAPTPASTSVAGAYDFTTTVEGQEVTGTLSITQEAGRYGGTLVTSATSELPLKSVAVEGQVVTTTVDTPDGELVIQVTLQGMDFTGSWTLAGQSGTVRGRKRG